MLRRRARDLGLSDAEVARRAGLSANRYSNYVRNDREPDLATLVKIAKVLATTPDSLLGIAQAPSDVVTVPKRLEVLCARADGLNAEGLSLAEDVVDRLRSTEHLSVQG